MLQAPLGLALATDVAALGTRLPVGALVVQDIRLLRTPAALRLRCADALVWDGQVPAQPGLTPSVLARSARVGCLALLPHPWAWSDAVAAGPRAWADGPLCHLCSSLHGAGTAVCRDRATGVCRSHTAHPGPGSRRPGRRVNTIWRRLPRWPPGSPAHHRVPAVQCWFSCPCAVLRVCTPGHLAAQRRVFTLCLLRGILLNHWSCWCEPCVHRQLTHGRRTLPPWQLWGIVLASMPWLV